MKSSDKIEVQLIVDACLKIGATHLVHSPGSRNAPFAIAFDEHPDFNTHIIPDERCAAFYALGMAQQIGKPVVICCTSGSASVNYFPAITEAYYQGIPLIVITADRPQEWINQGDGQTIMQEGIYGKHVLASAQLNPICNTNSRKSFERYLFETIQQVNAFRSGPIHLNVPLDEPLYGISNAPSELNYWPTKNNPAYSFLQNDKMLIAEKWNRAERKMIICGQLNRNEKLEELLAEIALDPSVSILVEHTSNLHNENFVGCIDRTLNQLIESNKSDYYPNLIVQLGGEIVSKRIKSFLRDAENCETIKLGNESYQMDTFRSLVMQLSVSPIVFCELITTEATHQNTISDYRENWKKLDNLSKKKHSEFLKNAPFSDLKVMETLLNAIPTNAHLHVSNSSVIRYVLLFDSIPTLKYWCNRGTSGIDGSTSTACGAALISPNECHVLITGDMSFFYDSNAFWNKNLPSNLRIFVLNNGGGDIFNIIPGPSSVAQHNDYFVAQQQFSAEGICSTFGVEYFSAKSMSEMEAQFEDFYKKDSDERLKLMEIDTSMVENSQVLKQYFR